MIQQSLHGYSEGHSLLAVSVKLSREQRTILSQMTDLSGPSPVRGFDGYVSGFPLPGGIYALAKTWFATELPRPGCVWTHSLLLTREELGRENVSSLAMLFRRPHAEQETAGYDIPLAPPEMIPEIAIPAPKRWAGVVSQVYSDALVRVCVPTESADDLEPMFLAIWNQQWPELRETFAFTTGMLGRGTRFFDLQGIPRKQRRLFQGVAEFAIFDEGDPGSHPDWAATATADAVLSRGSALRRFLWTFGRGFHPGRKAFRSLCETYQALSRSDLRSPAAVAYQCVLEFFEATEERKRLASALFGGSSVVSEISEVDALEVVARDCRDGIVDISDERIRERARALPLDELERLVLRLRGADDCSRLQEIQNVFAEKCQASYIGHLPTDIATTVLRLRPELARSAIVWKRTDDGAAEVLRSVVQSGEFTDAHAYGLLSHGDPRLLYESQGASRRAWVRGIHAFIDEHPATAAVESFVLCQLHDSQPELRDELRSRSFGHFAKLAAVVLDASIHEAERFPLQNAHLPTELLRLHGAEQELQACTFMLVIGLVREDAVASRFMREGFSPVYNAARDARLPSSLWRPLDAILPWHFLEWDRCARLIEGSVGCFTERPWPLGEFFRTFSTQEQFDRAVSFLVSMRQREFLRHLRVEAEATASQATSFQAEKLSRLTQW